MYVCICVFGGKLGRRTGGEKAESAFCIRYWFLIRGLRYQHLSMLYMEQAQLRILFAAPFAL